MGSHPSVSLKISTTKDNFALLLKNPFERKRKKIDIMKAYVCLFLLALAVSTIEGKKKGKGKGKGEIVTEGQALWLQPAADCFEPGVQYFGGHILKISPAYSIVKHCVDVKKDANFLPIEALNTNT